MPAPQGNQFWKMRSRDGRETEYTPGSLWEKACEFFEWCEANPWLRKDFVRSGERAGQIIDIPITRPFTISGLCIYLGIANKTFLAYEKREEFIQITTRIREIATTQKFEGAAVGVFNSNIIARDLGLRDKQELSHKGLSDTSITVKVVRPKDDDE